MRDGTSPDDGHIEKSEDNFVAVFLSNLPKIFCYDRRTIVTHLEDKHSEENLFELQNKLHIQLLEKFPQYVGSKKALISACWRCVPVRLLN